MPITGFILSALVGGLIGWLGGMLMKGGGFGTVWNIIIGVIGGFVGGCLYYIITLIQYSIPYQLIIALMGAVLMLWLASLLKKKQ